MNKYQQILTKYWGYTNFRPLQEDIIRSVDEGNDTLALLPTGGGKSITFQVPGLLKDGTCLVITPLIALMIDQVERLKKLDIKAIALHSGLSSQEIKIALDHCTFGKVKFLYIAPERIDTELFKYRAPKMNINLIAVDEAHCISQWGYDFRPSYLKISKIREILPNVPILALTATATTDVIQDIQEKLEFKNAAIFRSGFERKNLAYIVRETEDKEKTLMDIATKVPGSGIIYVRNRKKTREIADLLRNNKIHADYYHAGLDISIRNKKQEAWHNGQIPIIVATNAFGMGIDKSNVRFVVHYDLPDSLEEYFQEAGRAGRDGRNAYAVILYNITDDRDINTRLRNRFPEIDTIKAVYQALYNFYVIPLEGGKGLVMDFNIGEFCLKYNFSIVTTHNCLRLLQNEGYLEVTEEIDNPSRMHFKVSRDDLYKYQVSNQALDGFVKLLLRSYTGIFTDYVKIDEYILAKKAAVDVDAIYQYLNKLRSADLISYFPRKKTPLIIFNEERLDVKSLRLSPENYIIRKEFYITRLNAMLMYVTSNSKCRSQLLLQYFGDRGAERCGRCDTCIKRNELDLSRYEFDLILQELKSRLINESVPYDQLIDSINKEKEKVIRVIKWLIETNKIIQTDDYKLRWHN